MKKLINFMLFWAFIGSAATAVAVIDIADIADLERQVKEKEAAILQINQDILTAGLKGLPVSDFERSLRLNETQLKILKVKLEQVKTPKVPEITSEQKTTMPVYKESFMEPPMYDPYTSVTPSKTSKEIPQLAKQLIQEASTPTEEEQIIIAQGRSLQKKLDRGEFLTEEEMIKIAQAKSLEKKLPPQSKLLTKEEEEELTRIAIQESLEQVTPTFSEEELAQMSEEQLLELAVAKSLEKFATLPKSDIYRSLGNFIQLKSIDQKAETCGYWTLINAKAIQNLLDQGKQITTENIKKEIEQKKYEQLITQQTATGCLTLAGVADAVFDIRNMYILGFDPKAQRIYTASATNVPTESLDEFFLLFKNKAVDEAAFVLNLGNHWVLAFVARDQQGPHIYYLDSLNNNPISRDSVAEKYIEYLNKNIQ